MQTNMATAHVIHRFEGGLSWRPADEPGIARTSHALVDEGRVWLIDPIEAAGIDSEIMDLGEVAGVVVLLNRHMRDADRFALRYDVPLHVPRGMRHDLLPDDALEYDLHLGGTPFVVIEIRQNEPFWVERALWWPEQRTLVVADCLGSAAYYLSHGSEPMAVHPLLRLTPPMALRPLAPRRVLMGHGDPVEFGAERALASALDSSRSELPEFAVRSAFRAAGWARARLMRAGGHD